MNPALRAGSPRSPPTPPSVSASLPLSVVALAALDTVESVKQKLSACATSDWS